MVPKAGLFGFGKSKAEVEREREEEWEAQKALMAKRASGAWIKEADDRRSAVRVCVGPRHLTAGASAETLA